MSGKIDITNYEAWLLDYFEGNLSKEQITELKAFVLIHPELEIDLNDSNLLTLDKEDFSFNGKEELFKSELTINEETLIEYIEGNLSEENRLIVETELLKNRNLATEFELYKKAILVPDSEFYGDKNPLRKTEDDLVLANPALLYLENELSSEGKRFFEKELQNNSLLQAELNAFRKTKLEADYTVVLAEKESLKKEAKVVSLFSYRNIAAAAAVLVITGLTVIMVNYNQPAGFETGIAVKSVQKNNGAGAGMTIPGGNTAQFYIAQKSSLKNAKENSSDNNAVVKIDNVAKDSSTIKTDNSSFENVAIQSGNSSADSSFVSNTSSANNETVIKYTAENIFAMTEDDEAATSGKNGFWKRAVKFVQQVNGLGVKAVKGDEKNGEEYYLSFNSFSIEKK